MPTDPMLAFEGRLAAERAADAEQHTAVLLLPLIMGLLTIMLATQSSAFACAVIGMGMQ